MGSGLKRPKLLVGDAFLRRRRIWSRGFADCRARRPSARLSTSFWSSSLTALIPIPTRAAALIALVSKRWTRPCSRSGGAHAIRGCTRSAGRHGASGAGRRRSLRSLRRGSEHDGEAPSCVDPYRASHRADQCRADHHRASPARLDQARIDKWIRDRRPDCAPWPSRFAQRRPGRSGGRAAGGVVGNSQSCETVHMCSLLPMDDGVDLSCASAPAPQQPQRLMSAF
jgi:hypothetical protein